MTAALVYWVVVAAIGSGAATVSFMAGMTYYRALQKSRPELAHAYWPEMVRDVLLVAGLSLNLLVGITALMPRSTVGMSVGLIAVLGGATCTSLFAIFNLVLRVGR